jgi:hypothetical protein
MGLDTGEAYIDARLGRGVDAPPFTALACLNPPVGHATLPPLRRWFMRKKMMFALVPLTALSLNACATLFTGTKDTINFNSNPAGATVLIDGIEVGKTPITVPVKRSLSGKTVILRMAGYQDRTFELSQEFNVVSVLNLASIVGWGIDAATGSIMKYDRKDYQMDLERRTSMAQQLGVQHVVLMDELARDAEGNSIIPQVFGGSIAIVDTQTQQIIVAK